MRDPLGWCIQPFFGPVVMEVREKKKGKKRRGAHLSTFFKLILHLKLVFDGSVRYQKEKGP